MGTVALALVGLGRHIGLNADTEVHLLQQDLPVHIAIDEGVRRAAADDFLAFAGDVQQGGQGCRAVVGVVQGQHFYLGAVRKGDAGI